MRVGEVMTKTIRLTSPGAPLVTAARMMEEYDIGALPVISEKTIVGMVTDRDLIVRGVAKGLDPRTTPVDRVMTRSVKVCYEDQSVEDAAKEMQEKKIRRVVVLDRESESVTGILSLGDIAKAADESGVIADTLARVSEPD